MNGWIVACPDGKHRCPPYINHGDAACDAKTVQNRGRCFDDDVEPPWHPHGPCPDPKGEHTVEPIVYQMPAPRGQA